MQSPFSLLLLPICGERERERERDRRSQDAISIITLLIFTDWSIIIESSLKLEVMLSLCHSSHWQEWMLLMLLHILLYIILL